MMIDLLINQYICTEDYYWILHWMNNQYAIQIKWKKDINQRNNNHRQKFTSHVISNIGGSNYNLIIYVIILQNSYSFLHEKKEKCNLYKTHYLIMSCILAMYYMKWMISHSLHARIVIHFYRKLADCLLIKRKFIEGRLIYWLSERNFSKREFYSKRGDPSSDFLITAHGN